MNKLYILALLFVGVAVRFWAAGWGYTYDMESYEIVAKIVLSGGNVYAETTRYNYGPAWFLLLSMLYHVAQWFSDPFMVFRYSIVALLSGVDIALFFFLKRQFSLIAGLLYFLNPISIVVTGFYSQFDAIPLLLGFYSMALYGKDGPLIRTKQKILGLFLLGLSLIFKHVFFIFPIWIAVRQRPFIDKIIALCLPVGIFFLSFLPFIKDGFLGIVNNVFLYLSFHNSPLWHIFMPDSLKLYINEYVFFLLPLVAGAFIFRKKHAVDALMHYGMILVIFSLAISEQYFIYVLPFISVYFNSFFLLFTFVETLFMTLVVAGGEWFISSLRVFVDRQVFGFSYQVGILTVGFVYAHIAKQLRNFGSRQWIMLILGAHAVFLGFWILPDTLENKKVGHIETAIREGDYEKANSLYSVIEQHPPFAGSRFWNKLKKSRYYIEYYRSFRRAKDIFGMDLTAEKKGIIRAHLVGMPQGFPYREEVDQMLEFVR